MPPKILRNDRRLSPRWCHFLLIKFQLAIAAIILVGSSSRGRDCDFGLGSESGVKHRHVYSLLSNERSSCSIFPCRQRNQREGGGPGRRYRVTFLQSPLRIWRVWRANLQTKFGIRPPTQQEEVYWLTVISGEGSGPYHYGDEVLVTAHPPEPGQQFAGWEDDRQILADFTRMETTARIVRMEDLTITATYSNLPKYNLTVVNGTISGEYYANEEVEVTANAAPAGQQFASWTGNVVFANPMSPRTTLTMPAYAISVTATYTMSDRIRYYPRSGYRSRMVGGVFEGTNGIPAQGYVEAPP